MPELPEVETIKQDLETQVVGKEISKIEIRLPRMTRKHHSQKEVQKKVEGRTILSLERRGKFLLFHLDSANIIVLHLGMTGQLLHSTPQSPVEIDKYSHVIFHLDSDEALVFRDIRQFGKVYITGKTQLEKELDLGPEPLSPTFTEEDLASILNRTTKIKQLLMDQKRIAGIGNIYSDEILFEAGIHPLRPANSLTQKENHRLFTAIQNVLKEGIEFRGTSVDTYVDVSGRKGGMQNRRRIYRRTGEPCLQCGKPVQKIKIGGRSTHFCPKCQKWPDEQD